MRLEYLVSCLFTWPFMSLNWTPLFQTSIVLGLIDIVCYYVVPTRMLLALASSYAWAYFVWRIGMTPHHLHLSIRFLVNMLFSSLSFFLSFVAMCGFTQSGLVPLEFPVHTAADLSLFSCCAWLLITTVDALLETHYDVAFPNVHRLFAAHW